VPTTNKVSVASSVAKKELRETRAYAYLFLLSSHSQLRICVY
jgi:hypothetical protein